MNYHLFVKTFFNISLETKPTRIPQAIPCLNTSTKYAKSQGESLSGEILSKFHKEEIININDTATQILLLTYQY
jgi:hypothetical protein